MHPLLKEGLADAVGFILGGMAGFWIGRILGLDVFAPGYGLQSMGGIVLVVLGTGAGLQMARLWRQAQSNKDKS